MADSNRTPPHLVELLAELERAPHGFDFYQAVRIIDCAESAKPPTGTSERVLDDVIRFALDESLAFAPATLARCEPTPAGRVRKVFQRFMGLLGPNGPLPLHLTEYARDRARDKGDVTFQRFLDVFHHRMLSFFYRAWARVRPTVSFDKPDSDRFTDYVGSLFGVGMPSLRHRDALPDLPKLHFAGLLSCQSKHAEGLLSILRGYFCFPVQLEEFVGQWIELPAQSRCLMGSASASLGRTTTVGSHVWDCQQKFRIIIGPLSLEEYQRMLPGAAAGEGRRESLPAMVAAVRNYIGDQLDWDLQLILKREETPPVKMGEQGQLGWTSWMPAEVVGKDPDDLILQPMKSVFDSSTPS